MKQKLLLSFVVALLLLSGVSPLRAFDLKHSRDSLETLLQKVPEDNGRRRLELLNHLCDIDLSLGDTTYIYPCWQAAVRMHDVNSMDDLLIPLAMRAMRRGQADSVKVWQERCRQCFDGPLSDCNLEYLQMMQDLQDWENHDKLSQRIIKEQIRLDAGQKPYQAMRILYTLGILSSFEKSGNAKTMLKPCVEYMDEALAISRRQPFREAAHFTRQILLGLSSESLEYARQYLLFVKRFLEEPDMRERPFYSRRALIMAYERLIQKGKDLSRQELDGYYGEVCSLMEKYPNDTPVPFDFYRARVQYYYHDAIGAQEEALAWCDSLIAIAPRCHVAPYVYYGNKMRLLAALHRWEDAYHFSNFYMQAKDSVQNANSEKKLSELQTQYDVDTLRRKEEARRNQLILASICGVFLLMALAVYIVYSRRLSAKNSVLLEQLKQYALQLKAEQEKQSARPDKKPEISDSSPDTSDSPEASDNNGAVSASSLKLFARIDNLMRQEKLYLRSDLSRADLLERFGMNKNNLATVVMAGSGMNLSDYINEFRLRDALFIMEEFPDVALTQIADQTGFGTYSSFYRVFNKRFGVTPKEYKKYIS